MKKSILTMFLITVFVLAACNEKKSRSKNVQRQVADQNSAPTPTPGETAQTAPSTTPATNPDSGEASQPKTELSSVLGKIVAQSQKNLEDLSKAVSSSDNIRADILSRLVQNEIDRLKDPSLLTPYWQKTQVLDGKKELVDFRGQFVRIDKIDVFYNGSDSGSVQLKDSEGNDLLIVARGSMPNYGGTPDPLFTRTNGRSIQKGAVNSYNEIFASLIVYNFVKFYTYPMMDLRASVQVAPLSMDNSVTYHRFLNLLEKVSTSLEGFNARNWPSDLVNKADVIEFEMEFRNLASEFPDSN